MKKNLKCSICFFVGWRSVTSPWKEETGETYSWSWITLKLYALVPSTVMEIRESHDVQRYLLLSRILLSYGGEWVVGQFYCREGLRWGEGWREPSEVQQGGGVHPIPSSKELTAFPFLLGNRKLKVHGYSTLAYCSMGGNVLLFIFCHFRLLFQFCILFYSYFSIVSIQYYISFKCTT